MPRILAIETSCDETAAAVVEGDGTEPVRVLSSTMASQVALHAKYGGVFPDLAAREHTKRILPVIGLSLHEAGLLKDLPATRRQPDSLTSVRAAGVARRAGPTSAGEPVQRALESIDAIAVTVGPGLIGPLLIGTTAAKQLALLTGKPLISINHWEGHLYSVFLKKTERITKYELRLPADEAGSTGQNETSRASNVVRRDSSVGTQFTQSLNSLNSLPTFPILFLTVSGGHTSLILMHDHFRYEILGQTLDDAAGEAFDKTARMLGLPYPGGPALSRCAAEARVNSEQLGVSGREQPLTAHRSRFTLPRPMLDRDTLDFSFSGLKTAVRYAIDRGDIQVSSEQLAVSGGNDGLPLTVHRSLSRSEAAREIEDAIVDVLLGKLGQAIEQTQPASVAIVGGVSANTELRRRVVDLVSSEQVAVSSRTSAYRSLLTVDLPARQYCTDNAAMIGSAGLFRFVKRHGIARSPFDIEANASLRLDNALPAGRQAP